MQYDYLTKIIIIMRFNAILISETFLSDDAPDL